MQAVVPIRRTVEKPIIPYFSQREVGETIDSLKFTLEGTNKFPYSLRRINIIKTIDFKCFEITGRLIELAKQEKNKNSWLAFHLGINPSIRNLLPLLQDWGNLNPEHYFSQGLFYKVQKKV